jgi:threonine dehydrogenase-like Zn-dependent dehydrogenase
MALAPSQVLNRAIEGLAKAGTLSIIGVYTPTRNDFPIGQAMNKHLMVKICHQRKYIPHLLDLIASGTIDPVRILTKIEPMQRVIAPMRFDSRAPGWLKVELKPAAAA